MRALPLVAARHDVEVIAAGATIQAERDYLTSCHSLARDLGVAGRYRWLGQIDRAAKLDLFQAIDVFALPTPRPEAKGLSAIEALAAGVPVVASNQGAFPELLDGERAGLLHQPGDPADLARALAAVFADEEMAGRLGRHGHSLARSRHSAAAMAAAHEALYRELSCRDSAAGGRA